ncbi:MAG: BamA/TamA family outer membrane protein [Ginsengibacter sp.]
MKKGFTFLVCLFIIFQVNAQKDSIVTRVVLIGDAGKLNDGRQPVIDAVRQIIPLNKNTTVIFLGDNLYKTGLPDQYLPAFNDAKNVLDSQINVVKGTKATALFIPGNHDWSDGSIHGIDNVLNQQEYINGLGDKRVKFLPVDGCPGPEVYKISDEVIVIVYDSQWFIQKGTKPGVESDCAAKTPEQFYTELDDVVSSNKDKLIIMASHHTLKSYGIHGGYFTLKQHLFPFTDLKPNLWIPLPVLGTIYPIARGVFGTPEDLKYPAYASLIKNVQKITRDNPNIIFAGGHEHNLQLIKDSSNFYIVSGAGSKNTRVSKGKEAQYVADSMGFASIEISKNKNVHIDFYTVNETSVNHSFSKNLFNYGPLIAAGPDSTTIPESIPEGFFKDSVEVAINKNYANISGFHRFISGDNYRAEWATPVHLKVFRINKEMGGFAIQKLGGGKQTKSLKLKDKNGKNWALRTVDKDPEGVVPIELLGTAAQKIVQDMTSAQHPFGAAIVPPIAKAIDVAHASPKYYFVPDDPALGNFRQVFANKVCILEEDDPTPDGTDTKSTVKVINKILEDSKYHVDQEAVLRARLLDMVIGDWDRHLDQWKFGTGDTGVGKLYYPVPRDRDQSFFNSNGLLVKAVVKLAFPYLQGFKKNYPDIKGFNWEARDFDRIFMNNLDRQSWEKTIAQFQRNVNDSLINLAVKKLPPEIYKLDSAELTGKLISRKNLLTKEGMKYYRFLSKEVNIVGSNKSEYFELANAGDKLAINVYKRKEDNDSSSLMYSRIFDPRETKYINLYGLNGEDIFHVEPGTKSSIKLRIIGGEGVDTFQINGNIRNKIYDYLPGNNVIQQGNRTRNKMSASPYINRYDFINFKYPEKQIPLLTAGWNAEDKLLIGTGFSIKTYGFRKAPYSTYNKLAFLISPFSSAIQTEYTGIFNEVKGNNDLVLHGRFFNPVLSNFYGLGNNTVNLKNQEFNRVRYHFVDAEVLLRKRYFNDLIQVYFGPSYYHYWNKYNDNTGKVLENPAAIGLDSLKVYSDKSYVGGKMAISINNLNSELLPTRGVIWNTVLTSLYGIQKSSNNLTKLTSDLSVHASLSEPAKVVAILRFGGGHIFTDNFQYFQALTLGSDNYLRGYRKNRFAGQSYAYQTTELRIKLFELKSYWVPGNVGLVAFHEVGRVWMKNEISHKWHHDYGGGLYFSPFNFAIISATIAHSPEENLFNFSLGTKFNLTF